MIPPPPHKNSPRLQALHIEHLRKEREFLLLARDHHLLWMNKTDNPNIRALYDWAAKCLEETIYRYEELLMALENQKNRK